MGDKMTELNDMKITVIEGNPAKTSITDSTGNLKNHK